MVGLLANNLSSIVSNSAGNTKFYTTGHGIALSIVMPPGMQEVPRSITASGTFFRDDLVMNIFHCHSSSSADS